MAQQRFSPGAYWLISTIIGVVGAAITALAVTYVVALPQGAELLIAENSATADDAEAGWIPPQRALSGSSTPSSWVDTIVARDIFDASGGVPVGPLDKRRSDLKVELLATVVAVPASYSSALFREKPDGVARGYGVDDALTDDATVVRIEAKRVYVRRADGSLEYITTEAARSSTIVTDGSNNNAGRVHKTGEDEYSVESALIEELINDPEQLMGQIHASPHKGPDGNPDGYRLSRVRRGSLFDQLGVENGDIVHGVNGRDVLSLADAMDAFQSLQGEKSYSVKLSRRNQTRTLEYEVQ